MTPGWTVWLRWRHSLLGAALTQCIKSGLRPRREMDPSVNPIGIAPRKAPKPHCISDKHLIPVWVVAIIGAHAEQPIGIYQDHDIHNRSRRSLAGAGYHQTGKAVMAKEWAQRLVAMLHDAGIDVA
jgi:hypothetical protein